MRKADEEAEIISDWKFAAMVVDRSDTFLLHFLLFLCTETLMTIFEREFFRAVRGLTTL